MSMNDLLPCMCVQVWVLTGDKEETAIRISQATGHFPPGTTVLRLTNGQSIEEVGRAIYVKQEQLRVRLESKGARRRYRSILKGKAENKRSSDYHSDSFSDLDDFFHSQSEASSDSFYHRLSRCIRAAITDGLRHHRKADLMGSAEPVGLVIDGTTFAYTITVRE